MASLDNFRLVVFRAVAEQSSFRKAAEELYLTQPAVSFQIKALEEDIGVQLFDRTGAHIVLTPAGILRDADFQHLVGLATDVHRLQQGLNVIIQAAKVVAKHPDQEHVELLIHSAALFAGSPVLPTRDGHDAFQLTQEEIDAQASDGFNLENAAIPRPRF